jgi:hypothetical protein
MLVILLPETHYVTCAKKSGPKGRRDDRLSAGLVIQFSLIEEDGLPRQWS